MSGGLNHTKSVLAANPLIAILRGIGTCDVLRVAQTLVSSGFRVIEIPLNSPEAFRSIKLLSNQSDEMTVIGAGTAVSADDVDRAAAAGAKLILSPHMDTAVVRRAVELGLFSMPGVATPSEAFAALQAGAHAIKIFPANVLGPASINAWRAVLPKNVAMYAVGGIDNVNMTEFRAAGVTGAGLGSSLYFPGIALDELAMRAERLLRAWKNVNAS